MPKLAPLKHQGNENLFMAVEMSLISTLSGIPLHIHAEGLRGTGKTTVMRWAKENVPGIDRLKGCPYYCSPERPHCPVHRDTDGGGSITTERVPMPFVEIGHGAKLGTILGSIDLGKLTDSTRPEASLLPGAIPMANRGIIFIDEVNRLAETAPEITDVLLSVMGTKPGRVKIEEVGLPAFEVEVTSSVWAASNPDEDPGPLEDIRRQLADRFDLVIPVQRPQDPAIIERMLAREAGPDEAAGSFLQDAAKKAQMLGDVVVPRPIVRYLAQLYVHRNVESLRAVEALELASRLYAVIKGKDEVSFDELLTVIPLVLRHRVEPLTLSEILKDLELRRAAGVQPKQQADSNDEPPDDGPAGSTGGEGDSRDHSDLAAPVPADARSGSGEGADTAANEMGSASANTDAAGEGIKSGWLRQAFARYRESMRKLGGQAGRERLPSSRSGDRNSTGNATGSRPYVTVPNPKDIPPVSPIERARRLSALPWDELVNPPHWKDLP